MENLDVFVNEDNQVNEERPPPRICPRCHSDNIKFCYYNNYSVTQPRYFSKNCRRYWTHGDSLRNIPIGGSGRKPKRAKPDQPLLHVQQNNEFLGSFGGLSSSFGSVDMNHFGHNGMMPPIRSHHSDFSIGLFQQDYFNIGSNDMIGINQSFGGNVDNYNSFCFNQDDQNMWNQSFNNTMSMNHNASTSGNKGYSSYHLEKHGP